MKHRRKDWLRIKRLFDIRNQFTRTANQEKLDLLRLLDDAQIKTSTDLKLFHSALCFVRAFPDTMAHFRIAHSILSDFEERILALPVKVRAELWDTGMAGTPVHYTFSYEVATWLAKHAPGVVSIDWDEVDDTTCLDDVLEHLLLPSEDEYFNSGYISSKEWIDLFVTGKGNTDFDWLLSQLRKNRLDSAWSQLYNAADLPLVWNMSESDFSKSLNRLPVRRIHERTSLRKPVRSTKTEIMRPIDSPKRLSPAAGARLIDVAMASLATRHRETVHFNGANPNDVRIADVGEGVHVAILGLKPRHRFPLECTTGYLILSNGIPIGYGGASILFRQANTGINIFSEYRGSEASYLWTQVMRVYHHLTGCTRFIANAYQYGEGNMEALRSGAFWFYYGLGFRPVHADTIELAKRERGKIYRDRSYRSDRLTLRKLTCCDMHLTLPGARASELFDEQWIETSSMLATQELAAAGGSTRSESAGRVAKNVARALGLRSVSGWSSPERRAYQGLAPFVAATRPATWPDDAKRSMRKILRAKGGSSEIEYARLLGENGHFLSELRAHCRRAEH